MQLYIHIPFCKQKCRYCDFNSYPCQENGGVFDYLNGLNAEIELAGKAHSDAKIDTVYIGGGTPSILSEEQVLSLCDNLKKSFDLSNVKEWTIECNPESLTVEKLALYKNLGINRLSIGVQSLCDDNLRAVGRIHDAQTALNKLSVAREYFDNVSCDLIVGLPYDTVERVEGEIKTLAPFVSHISIYELILEEGTPLAKDVQKGLITLKNDDEVQEIFDRAIAVARDCGFERYEVSNFAKDSKISLHNFGYWTREEYLGFGAGAHSFEKICCEEGEKQIRYSNFCDIKKYLENVNSAKDFAAIERDEYEVLSQKDIYNEQVMLGLRTKRGIDKNLVKVDEKLNNFFEIDKQFIRLNDRGMAVMNSILTQMLDF